MKHVLLLFFCLFINHTLLAQGTPDEFIKKGIAHHDAGEYELAIEAYQHALNLDSNSSLAHYEIALTYSYVKQHEHALTHANKVIELNEGNLIHAFMVKGSSLDGLGRSKEAIKTYNYALKKLGNHYLLHYNLGVTYSQQGDVKNALQSLINAIAANPNHASSHLLLGYLMENQGHKIQSILSLHYFLLLEPGSARSPQALHYLKGQFVGNVERTGPSDISITISQDALEKKNEFGPAELMMSMLTATSMTEESEGKSKDELFYTSTDSFFSVLGELKKKKNEGLWWEFYIPMFYNLSDTDHLEAYCHYINQTDSEVAEKWLMNNEDKVDDLFSWLKQQNNTYTPN